MKVTGGLVGLTQNTEALTKFFLTNSELGRISSEWNRVCNKTKCTVSDKQHDLPKAAQKNSRSSR